MVKLKNKPLPDDKANPFFRQKISKKNPFGRPDPDPLKLESPSTNRQIKKKTGSIRKREIIVPLDASTIDPAGFYASQQARLNIEQVVERRIQETTAIPVQPDEFPRPTRYLSSDGTCVNKNGNAATMYIRIEDLADYCNICNIDITTIPDKNKVVAIFSNDKEWIEFFIGKTLLVPKKRDARERLRSLGKLGRLRVIQRAVSTFLDQNKWGMVEIWRGAGKSDLIIGKLLHRICDDPNISLFINSETDAKTIARVRVCKRELQTNQRIIYYYGYLPADNTQKLALYGRAYRGKWSEAILELKRDVSGIEPTLMGISWQTSQGLGLHFTGGVLDDPWSIKNQQTEGAREKFWEWFKEFMGSLEDIDFIWCICTRKGINDIYQDMVDDKMFALFVQPLVIQWPTNVIYHEINGRWSSVTVIDLDPTIQYVADDCYGTFTIEWALLTRKLQGIAYFEREYQNNPRRVEGKLFNWNKIKFCNPNSQDVYARMPYEHPEVIYGSVRALQNNEDVHGGAISYDPAFGTSNDASLNALLAMSTYHKRLYLLWAWIGHWDKAARVDAFNDARQKFPTFKFYVEKVMAQFQVVKDLTSDTGISLIPVEPPHLGSKGSDLFTNQKDASKKSRIYDEWEGPVADEFVYIMPDCPYMDEFEDEFKNFPDCLQFDMLDSGGMNIRILKTGGNVGLIDSRPASPFAFRGAKRSFPSYRPNKR